MGHVNVVQSYTCLLPTMSDFSYSDSYNVMAVDPGQVNFAYAIVQCKGYCRTPSDVHIEQTECIDLTKNGKRTCDMIDQMITHFENMLPVVKKINTFIIELQYHLKNAAIAHALQTFVRIHNPNAHLLFKHPRSLHTLFEKLDEYFLLSNTVNHSVRWRMNPSRTQRKHLHVKFVTAFMMDCHVGAAAEANFLSARKQDDIADCLIYALAELIGHGLPRDKCAAKRFRRTGGRVASGKNYDILPSGFISQNQSPDQHHVPNPSAQSTTHVAHEPDTASGIPPGFPSDGVTDQGSNPAAETPECLPDNPEQDVQDHDHPEWWGGRNSLSQRDGYGLGQGIPEITRSACVPEETGRTVSENSVTDCDFSSIPDIGSPTCVSAHSSDHCVIDLDLDDLDDYANFDPTFDH